MNAPARLARRFGPPGIRAPLPRDMHAGRRRNSSGVHLSWLRHRHARLLYRWRDARQYVLPARCRRAVLGNVFQLALALQRGRLRHKAFRDLAVEVRRAKHSPAARHATSGAHRRRTPLPAQTSVPAFLDCTRRAGTFRWQSFVERIGLCSGQRLRDHKSGPSWLLRGAGSNRFSAVMRPRKASPPMPVTTRRSAPSRIPARRRGHRPK